MGMTIVLFGSHAIAQMMMTAMPMQTFSCLPLSVVGR
jgi:hypothetical protein